MADICVGSRKWLSAPANAANRGAVPPAIRTKQIDFGLRYAVTPTLSLVAGVFEIQKPYYNLDDSENYRELGTSSNRGVEMSLTGTVRPGLTLVLGNVLLDQRISGELVENGSIGPRPIGSIRRRSIFNLDWRMGGGTGPLSFDIAVEALSARIGNVSNRLVAPPREMVDLGARYRFSIASARALLRLQVANVLDDYGWQVAANGAFQYSIGRRFPRGIARRYLKGDSARGICGVNRPDPASAKPTGEFTIGRGHLGHLA